MTDIFKGIHSLIKNKKSLIEPKAVIHTDPAPILSADSLLSTEKRQQALNDTQSLLSLPENEYQGIFLKVAENFAEFVQNLPETERSYYASLGGMLDHGLERAALSLFLCRTYLLPQDATLASVSESEMLWVYAVYTAALLYDIGKIATKHIITLTDQVGATLKTWLPYDGPMTNENASHYVYQFSQEHHDHMRWMVTPLLARQILPNEGFRWLASDTEVLESWLGLLSDEHRQVGSLLTVIPLADAQLLESYFTDRKIFRNNLSPQTLVLLAKIQKELKELSKLQKDLREKLLSEQTEKSQETPDNKNLEQNKKVTKQSLFGFPSLSQTDRETKTAIKYDAREMTQRFIQWLQKNSEKMSKKEGLIRAAEGGILLDHKVLQQFIADNKVAQLTTVDLQQLIAQTDVARPVNYTQAVEHALQTGQINNALLVHNPYLVFPSGPPSLAAIVGNPVPASSPVDIKNASPTTAEQYEAQQQKQETQQFKQAISTPRLVK